MRSDFEKYTPTYISKAMSLRKPQTKSLEILDNIVRAITPEGSNRPGKELPIDVELEQINNMFPSCTDFERSFVSLTFALATGVGKTRLMGAFIAYLYTQHDIKNFFVVAPNTTIYEKLKNDFSDWNSEKYVFKGLGCFSVPPQIITGDDYRNKSLSLSESDDGIHIFVYNIDKFNSESTNMRHINEMLGDSFYNYLSTLSDLVLIMDESHHYRAQQGSMALNDLHPLFGLELTATPYVTKGNQQTLFKNIVYYYPLSEAIKDGFTRTPYAVTRSDFNIHDFGDEQLDKLMLEDGITCHEMIKQKLYQYAVNNSTPEKPIPVVKPFMMVVCRDIDHANWVNDYVCSDSFCGGRYIDKTVIVYSGQGSEESEKNTRLLLDVERAENPIEIVIHVNKLKEGWDVNNLYTIVPLRTATSKILREQMVGRGLRLPYGYRTGDRDVDSVMLTAHDKFNEILREAQSGDSLFNENPIYVDTLSSEQTETTFLSFNSDPHQLVERFCEDGGIPISDKVEEWIIKAKNKIAREVTQFIQDREAHKITKAVGLDDVPRQAAGAFETGESSDVEMLIDKLSNEISNEHDFATVSEGNRNFVLNWIGTNTAEAYCTARDKYIPIPQVRIIDEGEEEYCFTDFDVDLDVFNYTPVADALIVQNFIDINDRRRIHGDTIDFTDYNPVKEILNNLCEKPEIDYARSSDLLYKIIAQFCDFYKAQYDDAGVVNGLNKIVILNKRDICNKLYGQLMGHFYQKNSSIDEEIIGVRNMNFSQSYTYEDRMDIGPSYDGENIKAVLFDHIQKGVFNSAKFDSEPELTFAWILEHDEDVLKWLRPAKKEFNITYDHGKLYVPDFVVDTANTIYLVEVKGENRLNAPDVIAKKERAKEYCKLSTQWGLAHGYKKWKYLFIPSDNILSTSSFIGLATTCADF